MLTACQILLNNGITITEEQTRIQAVEVDPEWLKRFDFVGTPKNVAIWEKKQHIGGLRIQVLP